MDWGGRLSPEAVSRYLELPAEDVEGISGHSVRGGMARAAKEQGREAGLSGE